VESNIDETQLTEFAFASRKYPEYMHPRMVECAECGLLYGNPVLAQRALTEAYKEAAFDSGQESFFASETYAKLVAAQLRQLGCHDSALDIGAGDGQFIERLLSLDFRSVTGIEPSAAPIVQSKSSIRSMIRQDIFRRTDFEPGQFDLITCFQVMEHLWDPAQLTRDVLSLLRPGGLFLSVMHDVNALPARVLGTKSPIFDIEHLQLFSRETIATMLQRAGFTDIVVTSVWNRYPAHYWLKLVPLQVGIKKRLIRFSQWTRLGKIACSFPAGNLAAAAWKPK
jgi:2-polyprenyl-3-methyl-5-hydroxy-6-metoxy-1,4-benzoquinol methylase